tara:strand:+ start:5497 stop:8223 length:2727 start_codon:yes stop_codon:yes gene_type:complete
MPATGSLAFIGAARYQGNWDAARNDGTASNGTTKYGTLLTSNGYHSSTNLTAAAGDYWQVSTAGNTNINGTSSWTANDWCVYSGSAWIRLSFLDTMASVVIGDLSESVFHMGVANDKHIIFATGSQHSGSNNFTFNYNNSSVLLTGNMHVGDDKKIYFGNADDSFIHYRESIDDFLTISGSSAGLVLSGSKIVVDPGSVASGSIAGPGSYLGVTATGQIVLTASSGGGSGDIEGVTAGNGLTGGGATGTVTLNVGAGTGIDVGSDDISVDVSDFMANGANNRVVTATGTDAQNAEANLLFDGNALMLTGSLHVSGTGVTITAGEAQSAVLTLKADQGDDVLDSTTFTVADSGNLTISASQGIFLSGTSMFIDSPATISGDLTVQGGDIVGPESANFRLASDRSFNVELDKDNTGSDHSFFVLNGAGNYVFRVKNTGEIRVVEDQKLGFGTNTATDCHIVFRDSVDDMMIISGSAAGLVLSGSKLIFDTDTVESGSLAGPGSYLGVTSAGQVVLTASSGGDGDITGVTAGNGLTGGGDSGAVTLTVGAGTGIDVSTNAIAVDVSDFMTNGVNNRVVTATGTDGMNAEADLTFDGNNLVLAGGLSVTGSVHVSGSGITLTAMEAGAAVLTLKGDQGDDAADSTTITVVDGGDTTIAAGGTLTITGSGLTIAGAEAGNAVLTLSADQGDDAADTTTFTHAAAGDFTIASGGDIILDPAGNNVLPGSDSTDDLGGDGVAWKKLYVDDIDLNGQGRIFLDEDGDTSLRAVGDDVVVLEVSSADVLTVSSAGGFVMTGSLHVSGGIFVNGFSTGSLDLGSGASITQHTRKGQVTLTTNGSLSAGSAIFFTLISNQIRQVDTVVASIASASLGVNTGLLPFVTNVQNGACVVTIANQTGGTVGNDSKVTVNWVAL